MVEIPGQDLLKLGPKEISIFPAFAFEGYPNRDSTPYSERYGIPEARTILRGTLRYKGNPSFICALGAIGLLNDESQPWLSADAPDLTWLQFMGHVLACEPTEVAITTVIEAKAALADDPVKRARILAGLKWYPAFSSRTLSLTHAPHANTILTLANVSNFVPLLRRLGLFSGGNVRKSRSILDTLAVSMSTKMAYKEGERDMIMLQHRFEIQKADGSHVRWCI